MAWPRRGDGGGAPVGLGEEAVAPGDSGQLKRREQVVEKRKTEAIALAQLGTTEAARRWQISRAQ